MDLETEPGHHRLCIALGGFQLILKISYVWRQLGVHVFYRRAARYSAASQPPPETATLRRPSPSSQSPIGSPLRKSEPNRST